MSVEHSFSHEQSTSTWSKTVSSYSTFVGCLHFVTAAFIDCSCQHLWRFHINMLWFSLSILSQHYHPINLSCRLRLKHTSPASLRSLFWLTTAPLKLFLWILFLWILSRMMLPNFEQWKCLIYLELASIWSQFSSRRHIYVDLLWCGRLFGCKKEKKLAIIYLFNLLAAIVQLSHILPCFNHNWSADKYCFSFMQYEPVLRRALISTQHFVTTYHLDKYNKIALSANNNAKSEVPRHLHYSVH